MNLSILLTINEDLELIFSGITAVSVALAGIGLFLSKRSEYLSVMNKCTQEFREIVRREKITDPEIIRDDYLGLFNEQLLYRKVVLVQRNCFGMAYDDLYFCCRR